MKTWLKENWFKLALIFLALGAFYWYEWQPTQIRKNCFDIVVGMDGINFDKNYSACLLDNGLSK